MYRHDTRIGPLAVGGWLFAELAAVLMIIGLASAGPSTPDRPVVPPPGELATAPQAAQGVLLRPVYFQVPVSAGGDGADTVARFRSEFSRVVGSRKVGLVLLFGVSRTGNALAGTEVSRRLRQLVIGLPELRTAVDVRPYIGGNDDGPPGTVRVELFLLNDG